MRVGARTSEYDEGQGQGQPRREGSGLPPVETGSLREGARQPRARFMFNIETRRNNPVTPHAMFTKGSPE